VLQFEQELRMIERFANQCQSGRFHTGQGHISRMRSELCGDKRRKGEATSTLRLGMAASGSPIQVSTQVESVGMLRTRGNADRANLHRVREAQVGMAIADRKEECRTADQFYCGGIFSCNSDNSKSTEACGKLSGEAQVSPPSIMPKLNR
jgi:hypothetical protein